MPVLDPEGTVVALGEFGPVLGGEDREGYDLFCDVEFTIADLPEGLGFYGVRIDEEATYRDEAHVFDNDGPLIWWGENVPQD